MPTPLTPNEILQEALLQEQLSNILARLRQARQIARLHQEVVANAVGVSRSTISFWETGQVPLTLDNLLRLARFYNTSPIWLLTGLSTDLRFEREFTDTLQRMYESAYELKAVLERNTDARSDDRDDLLESEREE